MFTLYRLENTQTSKNYIGQSTKLKGRLAYHKSMQKKSNNTKIGNDINQYGWSTFKVHILAMVETQEEADHLEKMYIEQYNSKEDGLNKNNGSRGTVKGTPKSTLHRVHMSDSAKGKPKSEAHKQAMSAARIGRRFPRG